MAGKKTIKKSAINEIINDIVEKSTYSDKEYKRLIKKANRFIDYLNKSFRRKKISAEAVLGGSFAKGTLLRNDFDCDVFARFKKESDMKHMFSILKRFKPEIIHGSRDYYNLKHQGISFEVVPVLWIKNAKQMRNTTDVSVFHVDWIKQQMKRNQKLRREIIAAKIFCKANRVYGAESYLRGFSGHVLDIIVAYYGSFIELVKAASKWKDKTIIDFYDVHKGNAISNLNYSKTYSPLIVIDPIQPERNAAAGMSSEKYFAFIDACKNFLKKPSAEFFRIKPLEIPRSRNIIIATGVSLKGNKDVCGSKILKALEYMQMKLRENDFSIKEFKWEWDRKNKFIAYFLLEKMRLPKLRELPGPPISQADNVSVFTKKYKKTYIKGNRLFAITKRKYCDAKKLAKAIITDDYIKNRVKSITIR